MILPILLLGALSIAQPAALAARPAVISNALVVPATDPQRLAVALVEQFHADPRGDVQFAQQHFADALRAEDPRQLLAQLRFLLGGRPTIERFDNETPERLTVIVRNGATRRWSRIEMRMETGRISGLRFGSANAPDWVRAEVPATEAARMARLHDFVSGLAAVDRFSGVVLIAKNDRPIFARAYGLADRGFRVPNRLGTRFNVGSIDKLFTALAFARLVEQGRASYDDPLSRYLDIPDHQTAGRIRIAHLLSHTAGLGDYATPQFLEMRMSLASMDDYMRLVDRLQPICLGFEPGTNWAYSNLGFLLAGRVIERITGRDYYDVVRSLVFEPAGMTGATDLRLDRVEPNVATPYDHDFTGGIRHTVDAAFSLPMRSAPDGGSVATATDLVALASALRHNRIVRSETFALMAAPKPELGSNGYGYGLMSSEFHRRFATAGRNVLGHGGDLDGGCASFAMVRDAGAPYTIVVLANSFQRSCHPVSEVALEMIPPLSASRRG